MTPRWFGLRLLSLAATGVVCALLLLQSTAPAEAVQSRYAIDNLVGRAVVQGAASYDVSGTVTLQGRPVDECTGITVWIFRQGQVGSDTIASTTTDAWGRFSFSHPALTNGTYDVRARSDSYLALSLSVAVFEASVTNANLGALPGGDLNGDNRIDFYDLIIMGADFGATNSRSDLNLDGVVDQADYVMVRDNYHRVGD